MDIKAFIPKDTLDLAILHPRTGEATDLVLTLAGPAHPARTAASRTLADAYVAKAAGGADKVTPEEAHAIQTQFVAACVVGWSGLQENGKAVPYSAKKAAELMADPRLIVIRNQVDRALGDNKRFFE